MNRRLSSWTALLAVTAACLLSLPGCKGKAQGDAAGKPGQTDRSGKTDPAAAGDDKKATIHRIAVETRAVHRARFVQRLMLFGQFEPVRTARVSVEMPGRVIDLKGEEGARVEAGTVLIRQDSTMARAQLAQADAGVAQGEAAVASARNQLARAEKLARSKVIDQARLDAARLGFKQAVAAKNVAIAGRKLASASLAKLMVKAPMSGTVVKQSVEVGEVANPGAPLLTLADFSTVTLMVDVPERNVSRVQLGSKIPLTVAALDDEKFLGVVTRIPMQADARNRTYSVEIEVSNPRGVLRGGMTARVSLLLSEQEQQVVIPLDAVIDEPTATLSAITSVVFVVEHGKARRVVVKTGAMQGHTVLIEAGLKGGEQLIVVGQRRVVDGDAVRVTLGGPVARADRPIGDSRAEKKVSATATDEATAGAAQPKKSTL